jgi:hypothetical protein
LFEALEDQTIRQLKQLAKLRGEKKYSHLTKAQLIERLKPEDEFVDLAETLIQVDPQRTLKILNVLV